jgi:hypothetical protein
VAHDVERVTSWMSIRALASAPRIDKETSG